LYISVGERWIVYVGKNAYIYVSVITRGPRRRRRFRVKMGPAGEWCRSVCADDRIIRHTYGNTSVVVTRYTAARQERSDFVAPETVGAAIAGVPELEKSARHRPDETRVWRNQLVTRKKFETIAQKTVHKTKATRPIRTICVCVCVRAQQAERRECRSHRRPCSGKSQT